MLNRTLKTVLGHKADTTRQLVFTHNSTAQQRTDTVQALRANGFFAVAAQHDLFTNADAVQAQIAAQCFGHVTC